MKTKTILTSTVAVAVATVLVKLFGFLREVTLAATYGAGVVSDAFVVAFTLPGVVLTFVGVSTASVFIPAYNAVGSGDESSRSRFMSNVLTMLGLIGLSFAIVFAFVPQALTYLFASQLDAETFALATELLGIIVWVSVPAIIAGILTAYLQIRKSFFLATVLSIPINVYVILSILLSGALESPHIMGYGVLAGNAVMIVCLFVATVCKGYSYRPVLDFKMPELRILLVMLAPVILISLIENINVIIDRNFASSLDTGSISALNYANKTIGIVTAFVGTSIATVLYPRMAEHAAQGKSGEIRAYITASFSKLIPLLLPAMVGVVLLAEPIVRLLFERGSFSPEDARRTSESLAMYAPLLVAQSLNVIMTRAFFSMRNTKTPAVISSVCVAVSVGLRFVLIGPLAHMGLALSSSVAAFVTTALLFVALRRRLGLMQLKRMGAEWAKIGVATAVMGGVVWLGMAVLPVMDGGTLMCAVYTGAIVLAGVCVYALMHAVLRTEFMREAVQVVRGVFAKRSAG